jgi:hypothetical protein
MNLREPLAIPADRPLDVLIHTRYSTDEQSQSSINGQINSCQRFLTANVRRKCRPEQVNVEIIRKPEISGEIADRLAGRERELQLCGPSSRSRSQAVCRP